MTVPTSVSEIASAGGWSDARVYDRLTDDPATREAKRTDYAAIGIGSRDTQAEAISGADIILSLVTADDALAALTALGFTNGRVVGREIGRASAIKMIRSVMVHGLRRAAEMEEVVKTLDALGTGSAMTRGTVERQRAIGALGLKQPEAGLPAKIEQIHRNRKQAA